MFQHILNLLLNVSLAVAATAVVVGWIRHRTEDYRDIKKSEISEDLSAADDLLEDVITERGLWEAAQRGAGTGRCKPLGQSDSLFPRTGRS
jgi:hypothetical protein